MLEECMRQIGAYTAPFVIGNLPVGSGTLVVIQERWGILTASHVATQLWAARPGTLALSLTEKLGRCCVSHSQIYPIFMGRPHCVDDQPDLAFIGISDPALIQEIQKTKSFYHIDSRTHEWVTALEIIRKGWSFVACSPTEFTRDQEVSTGEMARRISLFIGIGKLAFYKSDKIRNLDEWVFRISTGSNFPQDYNGVSGGGIWIVPLTVTDPAALSSFTPELIFFGVAYEQVRDKSRSRKLSAYGPKAIYVYANHFLKAPYSQPI